MEKHAKQARGRYREGDYAKLAHAIMAVPIEAREYFVVAVGHDIFDLGGNLAGPFPAWRDANDWITDNLGANGRATVIRRK
jgi:hypothetical protein